MEYSGYITDGAGRRIKGSFGILSAKNELLATDDTDLDGNYSVNANPDRGEQLFFAAPGYVTKVFPLPLREIIIVLNKPVPYAAIAAVVTIGYLLLDGKKNKVGALPGGLTNDDVKTIFLIIGGILSLDIITRILRALGIFKDPKSSKLDQIGADPASFWNPNYWKQSQNYSYTIDEKTAEAYADKINDALGYFNDDESAIISVFHQLRTKANISFLAWVYNKKFSKDLFTTLRGGAWPYDGISDADLSAINAYGETLTAF